MTEQEMMEAWMKTATPGPEHQMLARQTGEWKVSMKSWMEPGAPVSESEGTAIVDTMLGGRVRTEKFASDWNGMPFEGWGTMCFDNVAKSFWLTWNDSGSTNCFYLAGGTLSPDRKTITFIGEMPKPDGTQSKIRMTYRFDNEDHFSFEHFETANGTERQTMEMDYRRK